MKLLQSAFSRTFPSPSITISRRPFSSTSQHLKNRIWPATVRSEDELQTLLLASASTRIPLITLWMTTWCSSCKVVTPQLKQLIQNGIGEEEGSVSFAEIEMDAPTMTSLPLRYGINSIPTLLAFDRQEPQLETKVSRLDDLKNKAFLTAWIKTEARRHGEGGAGGRFLGLFGR